LLALTAPRVHAANAFMYRTLDAGPALRSRASAILVRALEGGQFLTRPALQTILAKSRVRASGEKLSYLVMHAELEGLICSGPRQGKQFTYALLESRVPPARPMNRDAALAELCRRYFASRGPASAHDFANWSGLTLADAHHGLESLGRDFERETISGKTHAFRPITGAARVAGSTFLMPDYDEYGMSYKDRSALLPSSSGGRNSGRMTLAFNRMIIVDGKIAGSWRRTPTGAAVSVETDLAAPLAPRQLRLVARATRRFTDFSRGSLSR
jgi:hypothetical protein